MKTLIIGGSGSGKSELAEQLCLSHGGALTYIATMEPFGNGAAERIERHRKLRAGKGFETLECYRNLAEQTDIPRGTVLLECLGNLVANEFFSGSSIDAAAEQRIVSGIEMLEEASDNLIIVTNDVFADGISYSHEMQQYLQLLGEINSAIARRFDRVIEVVCGLTIWHKGDGNDRI